MEKLLFNLYLIPTFTFNLFLYNTIVILIHCQFEKGGSRNKFVINVITNQNFSAASSISMCFKKVNHINLKYTTLLEYSATVKDLY